MTNKPARVKVIPKKGGLYLVGDKEKKPAKKKTTDKPATEDKDNVNES